MAFRFSQRSLNNLIGVHIDLQKVAMRALEVTSVDFVVIEGVRSRKRQEELVAAGASWTMNSRHLTGHAIDVAAWIGGIRWDWPLYDRIATAMFTAAYEYNVPIVWGGNWKQRDGAHFELDRNFYP